MSAMMPAHRCSKCGRLVVGKCPTCERDRDSRRLNAAARGYCSARWRHFRSVQLSVEPLCRSCLAVGKLTAADQVDHIQPVNGPNDPRFLDYQAVQSLCRECHSRKTAREDSTFSQKEPTR